MLPELLIICPLVFLAGFVDSIAGGGGLIALPAYLLAGLPPHTAIGTNKFSSTFGTSISVIRFARKGKINLPTVAPAVVFALIGAFSGARVVYFLSERVLQVVLMVMLPLMAVFILTRKSLNDDMPRETLPAGKAVMLSALVGLAVGLYDGFFGPGSGTFLIILFFFLVKLDLGTAMGNSRVVNLAANLAAMLSWLISGKIIFEIGIPAAICGMLGHYIGSGLALRNGAKIVRPIMAAVLVLLLGRIAYDFFF